MENLDETHHERERERGRKGGKESRLMDMGFSSSRLQVYSTANLLKKGRKTRSKCLSSEQITRYGVHGYKKDSKKFPSIVAAGKISPFQPCLSFPSPLSPPSSFTLLTPVTN